VIARFRAFYGANPLQLVALLASFALTAVAAYHVHLGPLPLRTAVWFAAAAIGHDLVLYPLYALADRSVGSLTRRRRPRTATRPAVPVVNHVRVPLLLSGLLLLIFLGPILQRSEGSLQFAASGRVDENPFLVRWLLITAVLFVVSAVAYAGRLGRHRAAAPAPAGSAPAGSV